MLLVACIVCVLATVINLLTGNLWLAALTFLLAAVDLIWWLNKFI